jgi:hypothetical protein
MTKIHNGQIVAMFAFDVGNEVSLDRLKSLMATTPVQPLSRKKQAPPYFQYRKPPQILDLGFTTGDFNDRVAGKGSVQALIFDFGAVSIAYRWKLNPETSVEDLPRISHDLYRFNLEPNAREQAATLMEKIKPAIVKPMLAGLVEDYYLFVIESLAEPVSAKALLGQYRGQLAQTLRFELCPLSEATQDEVLRQTISYYENDLAVVDWNAAVIYDRDFDDTINVLELLNVELLEARHVDSRLDQQINDYGALVRKRIEWPTPLRTPYRQALSDLAELRLESMLLAERVENALKLVGDQYLARLHAGATERFHLAEWERIISRKLEILSDFYQLLNDRLHTAQSQTMELAIVLLIVVELVLAFWH